MMDTRHVPTSRRDFLRLASAGAAGLAALLSAACQPAAPAVATVRPAAAGTPASAAASSALPAGFPVTVPPVGGPPPDLPSSGPWIDPGFLNYPTNPARFFNDAPGKGSEVSYFSRAVYPPATPPDRSLAWQEINKRLNASMKMNYVSVADYPAKLAALTAGNDLPDLFCLVQGLGTAARMSEFLQSQAADLTPYLAGDGIRKYPNLAVIPTYAWKNSGAVVNGHTYLLPIQQYRVGPIMFNNREIWDAELGASYVPTSADDFKRVLMQLNRPQDNRWAIGGVPQTGTGISFGLTLLAQCFGAPNGWRIGADGKALKDRETEEYKAAVGYTRELFAAGLYHPDQVTFSTTTARNAYLAGRLVVVQESFGGGWTDLWLRGAAQNPPVSFNYMVPFAAQPGVKPVHFMTPGFLLANGFKRASADRIGELLAICNWFAAPFGTDEDVLVQYGLKDSDYTLDSSGNPVPTQSGPSNSIYAGWQFIARHPWVLYYPGLPNFARVNQSAQQALLGMGIEDPTWGVFSPTFLSKGGPLETSFGDGVNDIIAGRRPFSDYDGLVRDWVANGGDAMRKEYVDLLAAGR